jgi:ABC-2 type transport system permease protein
MRPKLFWEIFTVEARKKMSYRADFWINSVAGIFVHLSFYWFLTYALFASGRPLLAGFSLKGMILYYVFVTLIGRLVQSMDLEMGISQDIYDGGLSRYLLYPVRYGAVKYAQQWGGLAPQVLQLLLFGIMAPFILGIPPEVKITVPSILMAAVSIILANLLHFLLIRPVQAVSFWADNVWSLLVAARFGMAMLGGQLLPLQLFPEWAQQLLAWLPFPYLYSFPTLTLLGSVNPADWARGVVITIFWCLAATLAGNVVWQRGDLQYTGVGI